MKLLLILFFLFTFLFPSHMRIDSTMIKDSVKSFRWSLIPIASQGQAYNQKYFKSTAFMLSQSYCLNQVHYYDQLSGVNNIKKRNDFAWWFLGVYISSIIDSYVDAELSSFPKRIE